MSQVRFFKYVIVDTSSNLGSVQFSKEYETRRTPFRVSRSKIAVRTLFGQPVVNIWFSLVDYVEKRSFSSVVILISKNLIPTFYAPMHGLLNGM